MMRTILPAAILRLLNALQVFTYKRIFKRQEALLIVFGEGGHSMAMKRMMQLLKLEDIMIIQLREAGSKKIFDYVDYTAERIMPKRSGKYRLILVPNRIFSNAFTTLRIFARYRIRFILTTGPIIAMFPCLMGKMFGLPCVFIESWARFSSISKTGKLLMTIGVLIFYQNWELSPLIPKGRYCGRL